MNSQLSNPYLLESQMTIFRERILSITQKDPSQMSFEEISYLRQGTQTKQKREYVIRNGGITIFAEFLGNSKPDILMEAFYAIGNIALEGFQCIQEILRLGSFTKLIIAVRQTQHIRKNFEVGLWAITSMQRHGRIPFQDSQICSRYLCELLSNEQVDWENLPSVLNLLLKRKRDLISQMKRRVQIFIQSNIIPKLIGFIGHLDSKIAFSSMILLNDVSSFASSSHLIEHDFIAKGQIFLFSSQANLREGVCFIFSNMVIDSLQAAQQLIKHDTLIQNLLFLFQNDQIAIRIQISHVFAHLLLHQIDTEFVKNLFLKCRICLFYVDLMLKCEQQNELIILHDALIHMEKLLQRSEEFFDKDQNYDIRQKMHNFDLKPILERFRSLDSSDVKYQAEKILEKYYDFPASVIEQEYQVQKFI